MLLWAETEFYVNTWLITVVLVLFGQLIPHSGVILVAQPFLQRMMVFLIGIPFLFAILICMQLTLERFIFMIIV